MLHHGTAADVPVTQSSKLEDCHKSYLAATIQLLEGSIDRMEKQLTDDPTVTGRFSGGRLSAEEEKQGALEKLRALRESVRRLAGHFPLDGSPPDLRQTLNAELIFAWLLVEKCRPQSLQDRGAALAPRMAAAVEANVEELATQIFTLRGLLR
jgi:hypothetical protein